MSKLVIVFLCCLAAKEGTGLDRAGWPGYIYFPSLNGWLKLHSEPTDYQEARLTCHLEEALLASVWNSDFTEAISQIISLQPEDSLQSQIELYSGSQISFSDGVYSYVKGETKLSLTPNAVLDLVQCIAVFANGTTGAVDCKQQMPYVCYAPVLDCGDETLGYEYASETGHCYKYHTNSVNWTTAYTLCKDEGAHLAVVNSKAEADFLKTLFPPGGLEFASIGFYYWKLSGHWWTIHGETIQQAGYATWRANEPTVGTVGHTYDRGFIHQEGTLYSFLPQTTAPFICEKAPTLLQS